MKSRVSVAVQETLVNSLVDCEVEADCCIRGEVVLERHPPLEHCAFVEKA